MRELTFNRGEVIIREGDVDDKFYLIRKGNCEVIVGYGREDATSLRTLGPGEYFGEMAVLEAYPRNATVIAYEDGTQVSEIPGSEIDTYFKSEPEKIIDLFKLISDRIRLLNADYAEAVSVLEKMEAPEAEKEGLLEKIGAVLAKFGKSGRRTAGLSAETKREMDNYGKPHFRDGSNRNVEKYDAGTVIFREGEPGRCIYAIHWGKIGIFTGYGTVAEKKLAELVTDEFFGDMGMIEGLPRTGTAVALEKDTTLEAIYPYDLANLFEENPMKVEWILEQLSHRLRKLNNAYVDVCRKISEKKKD